VKIDKEKIVLVVTKYLSYLINFIIIAAVVGFVAWFIWGLVVVIKN
jgi:hypothetical protein